MATQRYISTSFWDDKWIRSLDPSEKFVYLYLMTNPLTNIAGVYQITTDRICFDTGYNSDTVDRVLSRFHEVKKACRYKDFIILPSWPKHQKWQQRTKIEKGIVSIIKSLDPDVIGYLVEIGYTYPIDTLSIPYTYVPNYLDLDSNTDIDTDTDLLRSEKTDSEPEIITLPALTPTAEPKGSVSKQTKSLKIPEADLPLYNNVKKYYEEQQDSKQFTNYPKEATAIKGLIEKSKIQAPDNHVEFLKMLTSVFKELRNIDPFYGKHPFLPSSLNSSGIFDRVLNEAQMKWKEKQEASAFDVSELY